MKKTILATVLALASSSAFAANMGYDSVGFKVGMLDGANGSDPKELSLSLSKELTGGLFGVINYTNTDFDNLAVPQDEPSNPAPEARNAAPVLDSENTFEMGLGYHFHVAQPVDIYAHAGLHKSSLETTEAELYDETMFYARVGTKLIPSEHIMFDVSYGMTFGADNSAADKSDFAASINYFISDEFSLGVEYAHKMYDKEMALFGNGGEDTSSKVSFLANYNF